MACNTSPGQEKASIIGVIPRYPRHTQHNIYGRVRMPPVGIVSVLSQLARDTRLRLYAIDENNYGGPTDFTGMPDHDFLQQRQPSKIAMFYGGMSNSIPRMFSIAKKYKKFGAVTIAGGSHVDALPEEALHSGIDIIVHNEGEETVKKLANIILDDAGNVAGDYRDRLREVRGISFLHRGKHIFTGPCAPIKDLDSIEDTDLTLIRFLQKRWTAIPINKGRGCNFRCEFCVVNKQYGAYKACSIEKTMRQVTKYSDMGYTAFFFTDDYFAQNAAETIELCKRIGDYKRTFRKKIDLIVQVRSEVADNDELIQAMKYAGVTTMAIGYESPIDEELKAMKKGVTVKLLIERSRKLAESFYLHGMFIFGYPKPMGIESAAMTLRQRAKEYARFFRKAKLDTVQVVNAVPLPGSELRARLEKEGRVFPKEMTGWDKYDGLFLCYDPTPEGLDPYELQNLPKILMKKRYMGNFLNSTLNYGHWIEWAYSFSIGFPINFSAFYARRFARNILEKGRKNKFELELSSGKDLFYHPLLNTWGDMKRRMRNLVVKTYAGTLIRDWTKEYKKSNYSLRLNEFFMKRHEKPIE